MHLTKILKSFEKKTNITQKKGGKEKEAVSNLPSVFEPRSRLHRPARASAVPWRRSRQGLSSSPVPLCVRTSSLPTFASSRQRRAQKPPRGERAGASPGEHSPDTRDTAGNPPRATPGRCARSTGLRKPFPSSPSCPSLPARAPRPREKVKNKF